MNETWKHYVGWKKPVTKEHMLCDMPFIENAQNWQMNRDRKKNAGSQGLGEEGTREWNAGCGVSVWGDEMFSNCWYCWSQTLTILKTIELYRFPRWRSGKESAYSCQEMPKMEVWSLLIVSDSLRPHGLEPSRLLCPWDSPGKNTGVGCHFLLQEIFPTQGSNLCLLHGQADSLPLTCLGSPWGGKESATTEQLRAHTHTELYTWHGYIL